MVEEQALHVFEAVSQFDKVFARDLTHQFTGIKFFNGDDGAVNALVEVKAQVAVFVLHLAVELVNGLLKLGALLLGVVAQVHLLGGIGFGDWRGRLGGLFGAAWVAA